MTGKLKRIYTNSRLTKKTKLKLFPVTDRHLEFWGWKNHQRRLAIGPLKSLIGNMAIVVGMLSLNGTEPEIHLGSLTPPPFATYVHMYVKFSTWWLKVYVTVCAFQKSISFDATVEITNNIRFPIRGMFSGVCEAYSCETAKASCRVAKDHSRWLNSIIHIDYDSLLLFHCVYLYLVTFIRYYSLIPWPWTSLIWR